MKRRTFVGTGAAVVVGALAGCLTQAATARDEVTETVSRTFSAPDVREVRVHNDVGNVLVAAQGTGGVDARVVKRSTRGQAGLDQLMVRIDLDGGVLTVETNYDRPVGDTRTPSADVTVNVPETASPAVSAITSEIGDITLLGTRGDTVARTDIGDVVASGVDGYLLLSSRVGTVIATDVAGLDGVDTGVGSITVDLLGVRDDLEIRSDIGDITVGVADDLNLDILAETNGSLDANLPVSDVRTEGSRYTARLNEGGHRLRTVSDLGTISLRSIPR